MWKNTVPAGQATDDSIIRRMPVACSITKAYDTNSEYVLLMYCNNRLSNAPNVMLQADCLSCFWNLGGHTWSYTKIRGI